MNSTAFRMVRGVIVIATMLAAVVAAAVVGTPRKPPLPSQLDLRAQAPDSFLVEFATTKGRFVVMAHRDWSPLGADRFYHLMNHGFYDGTVFYRVGPTASYKGGWVVQFGVTNDAAINAAWDTTGIADEPVRVGHRRGMMYFARGGPRTRSTQIALDLTSNAPLDTVSYQGVVGFPPIAEVIEGLAVLDSLNRRHGNAPMQESDSLALGRAYLDRAFPGLDRIESVTVTKAWGRDPGTQ